MKTKVEIDKMEELAKDFLSKVIPEGDKATIVGLKGNLGAGKTTFTQYVAKILGISEKINSPTFVIEKIYKILDNQNFDTLIHIDAYRLDSGKELEALNWNEIIEQQRTLILIEWPEQVSDILPNDLQTIEFEVIDEKSRQVEFINFND